jgi:hypothetical protein
LKIGALVDQDRLAEANADRIDAAFELAEQSRAGGPDQLAVVVARHTNDERGCDFAANGTPEVDFISGFASSGGVSRN